MTISADNQLGQHIRYRRRMKLEEIEYSVRAWSCCWPSRKEIVDEPTPIHAIRAICDSHKGAEVPQIPLFPPLAKGDDRGINAEELPEVVLSSPSIVGIRCSFRVEPSREPALRSFQ